MTENSYSENHALLIGYGRMGRLHFERLQKRGIVFDAVLDSEQEVSKYLESLKSEKKNPLIIIASPSSTHFNYAQKFLKRGCPVFVEKPIALSGEEARELQKLALKKRTLLFVGHSERYHPNFLKLRSRFHVSDYCSLRICRENKTAEKVYDSDVVFDLMIHDINNLTVLMQSIPEIESVKTSNIQENATVVLNFENRFRATLNVNRNGKESRRFYEFEKHLGELEKVEFPSKILGEDALDHEYHALFQTLKQPDFGKNALEYACLSVEISEKIICVLSNQLTHTM